MKVFDMDRERNKQKVPRRLPLLVEPCFCLDRVLETKWALNTRTDLTLIVWLGACHRVAVRLMGQTLIQLNDNAPLDKIRRNRSYSYDKQCGQRTSIRKPMCDND